jgi:hypothetical protein
MTDDEIEVVAEELAKISGFSWHRGREPVPLMRVVTDRYRARARAVIAALDRLRAGCAPSVDQGLPCRAGVRRAYRPHSPVAGASGGTRPNSEMPRKD